MWLHSVGRRCAGSTRASTRSPGVQLAPLGLEHERLVVAEAHDVDDARAAVAVLALDDADVGDLAAARRVERGLDELGQHAAVLARRRAPTAVACSSRS